MCFYESENWTKAMKSEMWAQHKKLIVFYGAVLTLVFALCISTSKWLAWQEVEVSDVVGEGSIFILTIIWSLAVLMSRPKGRVTSFLIVGLSLFSCSSLIDVFDEFTDPMNAYAWISLFESIPAAVGMIVMSFALYWWHKEQLSLNKQLNRRELDYRWHKEVDPITLLYRADYFIERAKSKLFDDRSTCIAVLDLVDFSSINRRFGLTEGDRILREIGQVILMNIHDTDLACRYAGDRFVLLLPNTKLKGAETLLAQVERSINSIAFKPTDSQTPVFNQLRYITKELSPQTSIELALQQLNQDLENQRGLVA